MKYLEIGYKVIDNTFRSLWIFQLLLVFKEKKNIFDFTPIFLDQFASKFVKNVKETIILSYNISSFVKYFIATNYLVSKRSGRYFCFGNRSILDQNSMLYKPVSSIYSKQKLTIVVQPTHFLWWKLRICQCNKTPTHWNRVRLAVRKKSSGYCLDFSYNVRVGKYGPQWNSGKISKALQPPFEWRKRMVLWIRIRKFDYSCWAIFSHNVLKSTLNRLSDQIFIIIKRSTKLS